MTDHPPPLPPIGVRQPATVRRPFSMWDGDTDSARINATPTAPLGLSPEQPCRLSGEPMP